MSVAPLRRPFGAVLAATGVVVALAASARATAADDPLKPPANAVVVVPDSASWQMRLPKSETVAFRGQANFDSAGGRGGAILYPAPNIVGLFAAILTHGAIMQARQSSERDRIQADADRVLDPYRDVLATMRNADLVERSLPALQFPGAKRVADAATAAADTWTVELDPVFTLTQDQTALILHNAIVVYAPQRPAEPAYRNVITVVLRAASGETQAQYWTDAQGARLRVATHRMLAESLNVAYSDMTRPAPTDTAAFKTIRYAEGRSTRIERAETLALSCERWLIRDLRGWLKSVPAPRAADTPAAECTDPIAADPPPQDAAPAEASATNEPTLDVRND